jgi:hypothetical protein
MGSKQDLQLNVFKYISIFKQHVLNVNSFLLLSLIIKYYDVKRFHVIR